MADGQRSLEELAADLCSYGPPNADPEAVKAASAFLVKRFSQAVRDIELREAEIEQMKSAPKDATSNVDRIKAAIADALANNDSEHAKKLTDLLPSAIRFDRNMRFNIQGYW